MIVMTIDLKRPNALEFCNEIDDNCDGTTDENAVDQLFYNDADGDGWNFH